MFWRSTDNSFTQMIYDPLIKLDASNPHHEMSAFILTQSGPC